MPTLIMTIEGAALGLLLLAAGIFLFEYIRYMQIKKMYKQDYYRTYRTNRARGYYPLVPKPDSDKYKKTQKMLTGTSWHITVEEFFLIKWGLFIVGLAFIVSMQTTNLLREAEMIVENINYSKNMLDVFVEETPERVKAEKELYRFMDAQIIKSDDIYKKQNAPIYIEYIENILIQKAIHTDENPQAAAKRIFAKIKAVRAIEGNVQIYILGFLLALLLYHLPDILAAMKIKLIEDKKDWEVLNCIFAFSIFGRLPPYSIKIVLESMTMVTDVYRPTIMALLESVKKGKEEDTFDEILAETDNEDLCELLETMRLARETGLLNSVDDVDEMAADNLKWLEIKGIKRRNSKRIYAMIPVAIMFLLGGIYFAYALTVISNPSNIMAK